MWSLPLLPSSSRLNTATMRSGFCMGMNDTNKIKDTACFLAVSFCYALKTFKRQKGKRRHDLSHRPLSKRPRSASKRGCFALLCLFFKHFCREYNNIIQCCSLIVADILKLNSNLSMRKKFLPRVLWSVAFSLSSAGQYLVFVGSDPFLVSMDLFRKKDFSVFRGFGSSQRRDGSVLEGTICKQFVMSVKNRKNLKPCRGFKSFRSLTFNI